MSSVEIWLRLMAIQDICGDIGLKIAHFLQCCPVIDAESLAASGLNQSQCRRFLAFPEQHIDQSRRWLQAANHHLVTAQSKCYPETLRAIPQYPLSIMVKGNLPQLSAPQIAVVGSRELSDYGARYGRYFSETVAEAGLVITSGMALGIDGVAHRAALRVQRPTIAVLGNGLASLYPQRHAALGQAIVAGDGAIVSEFPLHFPPRPRNFPWRNRVISGLSRALLVIEAGERSGSLVTARYAAEQGREVFALPGLVGSPGSAGPHRLIQQGAQLVTSPEELLDYLATALRWLVISPQAQINCLKAPVSPLPIPKLLANVGDEVTPVDVVAERAGQPVPETVAQLLELELAGWIAAVPGGYVRLRRASHVRCTNVLI